LSSYIPAARIELDGIDITANLIPAPFGLPLEGGGVTIPSGFGFGDNTAPLISLTVTDNEGEKSDSVELEISNRDNNIPAPKKGAKLKVWLGYADSGLIFMGEFVVDEWTKKNPPRTLSVSAKSAGFTTDIKAPKSRSYHDKTVEEIYQQVAGKHKLGTKVHNELGKVKIKHIDQSKESDANFLTRLAKRVGGTFKLANNTAILNKPGSGQLPGGGEAPTFSLSESDVTDWSATGSARGSYKSASAEWQDTEKGERTTTSEGEGKPRYRDRKLYKTEEEAKAAIKGTLDGLKRGKVTLSINMPGRAEIFAGSMVNPQFDDPDVDGPFSVKTATHTLDDGGFKSALSCESKDGGKDNDEENEE
jgi:phage protein D